MEVLLPLIIFAGGIIYTVIAGRSNKDNEKRDVDPGKMERSGRSAPRRRQTNSESQEQQKSGGLFDELKREFKKEYDKAMGTPETETSSQPRRMTQQNVKDRVEEERQRLEDKRQQEKRQSSMRQRSRGDTHKDKETVERRQSERASRARDRVYTGAYESKDDVEVAEATQGIGSEISGKARYSYDDDRTEMHERYEEKDKVISHNDLTFDKKAVVNGIIFSEILGKPKSRK